MTSQQDTELSLDEILMKVLLVWKQDYPKPDGDSGLLMDEYFQRLEDAKTEAIQALTSWKDKEVRLARIDELNRVGGLLLLNQEKREKELKPLQSKQEVEKTKAPDSSSRASKSIITQEVEDYYSTLPKVRPPRDGRWVHMQTGEIADLIISLQSQGGTELSDEVHQQAADEIKERLKKIRGKHSQGGKNE